MTRYDVAQIVISSHGYPETLQYLRDLKASHDELIRAAKIVVVTDDAAAKEMDMLGLVVPAETMALTELLRTALINAEKLK